MINQMSPLYRKILAATLLAGVIFITASFIVLPLYTLMAVKSDYVDQLSDAVARYQTIIDRKSSYGERLKEIRGAPLPAITYEASSHAALNAQMQNDIRQIIQRSGGRIDNMQSIPPTPADEFQKIGLRLSLRAETKVLNNILENIGKHAKLLHFDQVSIRTAESQGGSQAPVLTIRWDIYGYGLIAAPQEIQP